MPANNILSNTDKTNVHNPCFIVLDYMKNAFFLTFALSIEVRDHCVTFLGKTG